jgi:hypothetical protein
VQAGPLERLLEDGELVCRWSAMEEPFSLVEAEADDIDLDAELDLEVRRFAALLAYTSMSVCL